MTTGEESRSTDRERLNANLARIEALSQRLVNALAAKRPIDASLKGPSGELFMRAGTAYLSEMMHNPAKVLESQIAYWGKALTHYVEAQQALAKGRFAAPEDPGPKDRRFANSLWDTHPYFNFVKKQYLLSSKAMEQAIADLDNVDGRDKRRLEYFTRQIIDLFSPTNFLGTNPDALERAVATDGESLVQGLENLVSDLEATEGELLVTLADRRAFKVGENLATAKGSVVFRNRMFELIQYAPTTETVHRTPIIIFPPWINKFYILDLKPQNSLIRWVVDQGYTLFVVSWVNPDARYADVGLDTYVEEGYLTAIDQVKTITGEDKVNAVGYCIAGTMLGIVLALLHKRGDHSVRSATFFTTLTDFSDQGEFTPFLDEDFLAGIEREVGEKGVLQSFFMSRTFSYLRSNDLVYGPAIRSYMMGEAPPAFDLLYWNGDATNLPARMTVEYLRWLCQKNLFAGGEIEVLGQRLSLRDVRVPLCAIACETDHIAAWESSFHGMSKMGSRDKTFILSESGHVAGIVNPPSRNKYGHYTGAPPEGDAGLWLKAANYTPGSWWPRWEDWLSRRSGGQIAARVPGSGNHPVLESAPGDYVRALPGE